MENVAVMWSGWMAARRIGRKIGTRALLLPLSLMGLTECSAAARGDDNRVSLTPRVIHDVSEVGLHFEFFHKSVTDRRGGGSMST